jgi:hypothetical protein
MPEQMTPIITRKIYPEEFLPFAIAYNAHQSAYLKKPLKKVPTGKEIGKMILEGSMILANSFQPSQLINYLKEKFEVYGIDAPTFFAWAKNSKNLEAMQILAMSYAQQNLQIDTALESIGDAAKGLLGGFSEFSAKAIWILLKPFIKIFIVLILAIFLFRYATEKAIK